MSKTKILEIIYNDEIDIFTVQRVLEIFINITPTGELRNKLCDANIEAMSLIQKQEDESTTTNNT